MSLKFQKPSPLSLLKIILGHHRHNETQNMFMLVMLKEYSVYDGILKCAKNVCTEPITRSSVEKGPKYNSGLHFLNTSCPPDFTHVMFIMIIH